jgi:hypothetical protein
VEIFQFDRREKIAAGQGVRWDAGEVHTTGAAAGLVAIAVEGALRAGGT